MKVTPISIPGCFRIIPDIFRDDRGYFVKVFHHEFFREQNLETDFAEEFFTFSRRRVLRGLHFQAPPKHHTKLVTCLTGEIFDVVLDIREGSPTFGKWETFTLNDINRETIYLPPGMAHGFYTLSEGATVLYNVTSVHSPVHDLGILWSSSGIDWPDTVPTVSSRDRELPALDDFTSPFKFEGK